MMADDDLETERLRRLLARHASAERRYRGDVWESRVVTGMLLALVAGVIAWGLWMLWRGVPG